MPKSCHFTLAILLAFIGDKTVRDEGEGSGFSGPRDRHVVPLAVGDGHVHGELEEHRLDLALEEVDVDARVDGLHKDKDLMLILLSSCSFCSISAFLIKHKFFCFTCMMTLRSVG